MVIWLNCTLVLKNLLPKALKIVGEFIVQKPVTKCLVSKAAHRSTQHLIKPYRVNLTYCSAKNTVLIASLELLVG